MYYLLGFSLQQTSHCSSNQITWHLDSQSMANFDFHISVLWPLCILFLHTFQANPVQNDSLHRKCHWGRHMYVQTDSLSTGCKIKNEEISVVLFFKSVSLFLQNIFVGFRAWFNADSIGGLELVIVKCHCFVVPYYVYIWF